MALRVEKITKPSPKDHQKGLINHGHDDTKLMIQHQARVRQAVKVIAKRAEKKRKKLREVSLFLSLPQRKEKRREKEKEGGC